jgi:uncharacterized membrane protein
VVAGTAIQEITQVTSQFADALFKVEVCNNEYLPVYVAYAGRPDPNSDMWMSNGWYEIASGECGIVATLTKGDFFLTANNRLGPAATSVVIALRMTPLCAFCCQMETSVLMESL